MAVILSGGCLSGGRGEHVLPAGLGHHAVDQHLGPGLGRRRRHVDGDVGAVHLVGAKRLAETAFADRASCPRAACRAAPAAGRAGMATVSWLSTLPSTPASATPLFCSRLNGSPVEHLERRRTAAPAPCTATRPVRGSGSVMSTVKVPFMARLSAVGSGEGGVGHAQLEGSGRRGARGRAALPASASRRRGRRRGWRLQRQRALRGRRRRRPARPAWRPSSWRAGTSRPAASRAPDA